MSVIKINFRKNNHLMKENSTFEAKIRNNPHLNYFYTYKYFPMNFLKLNYLALLLLSFTSVLPISAQKKKTKQKKVNPIEVVKNMMNVGEFQEAQEYITKELKAQSKLRKPTCNVDSLHILADSIRITEAYIRATQQIIFVDSILIPRNEIFKHLTISPEMGQVINSESISKTIGISVDSMGQSAYINALSDLAYFPLLQDSLLVLHRAMRIGQQWSKPEPLDIKDQAHSQQDYPFILADGISLYYSSTTDEGIGGWDIYVTRYDNEEKSYLKPQNIGMPFNSSANDILYIIDENTNVGYFATDRRCPQDSVCLYTFIPNASHTTYPPDTDFQTLYRAAQIHSILDTQRGHEKRIEEWKNNLKNRAPQSSFKTAIRYIISNDIIYQNLDGFRSSEAKSIAVELTSHYNTLLSHETLLGILRKQYSTKPSSSVKENILQIEFEREQTLNLIKELEKKMRQCELIAR